MSVRAFASAAAALSLSLAAAALAASGLTALDRYLDGLETLRAEFVQTVIDARGREVDRSTGTLVVSRPGRFRWEIHPRDVAGSSGQLMVADGKNVWFFDRDLEQVTVKPADEALSATPAMLLSGAVDVREAFRITDAGRRERLDWVLVEPLGAEADFRRALLGFSGGELRRMILDDKLGQTATVIFEDVRRNVRVSPEEVSFTPPPGADLIGTPR